MLLALLVGALAVLAAALYAQRVRWLSLALFWIFLGAWCAEMEPQPAPDQPLAQLSDGLLRTAEGAVVQVGPVRRESPQTEGYGHAQSSAPAESTQSIDLRLSSLEQIDDQRDEQIPTGGTVRLTIRWPNESTAHAFACGERLRVAARLLPPQGYHDPDVWSRADFLLDYGITSTASVRAERVEFIGSESGQFLLCHIHTLQYAATARLLELPQRMHGFPSFLRLSVEDAQLLSAMIAGDRSWLNHSLRVGFERTGSFHMLVVSGFHLAIVAGFFFWVAERLCMPRVAVTLTTVAASLAYALFTGFAVPVQRSLWMVVIYLLTRLLYRERNVLNTIGVAALALLVVSPRSFFDASFQMTLLAVVAIGGIAAPLLKNSVHMYLSAAKNLSLQVVEKSMPPRAAQFRVTLRMVASALERMGSGVWSRWCAWTVFPVLVRCVLRAAEWIVVSCVVELAMVLPMAIYFHRITFFALPVNVLVLPLLLLLLPAALCMMVVLAAWPAAAMLPASLVAAVLHTGVGVVRWFSRMALADHRIPAPLAWQIFLFVLLLVVAIRMAQRERKKAVWCALLLAAVVAILPRAVRHPQNALLVEAIDVGQGDSLLLITPEGKSLLIDAGGFGGGPHEKTPDYDIGEEVVSTVLWERGIQHLDAVALTHAHSDHMGGMPTVLRNFHPDELWVGENPPVPAYTALLKEAADLGVRVRSLHEGDVLHPGQVAITVLAPQRDYRPEGEPGNNDSLVLRAAYGKTSALLEGDAEAPVEETMLAESGLESTLLKVGHHGSRSSTQPAFLQRVHPQWAVISCGLRNRYGHPREEVLEELQSAGVRTLSTDTSGALCFRLDGTNTTEMACAEKKP